MSELPSQSQIDAAKAYEALFVPALFGQWAPKLAEAAHIQSGQRALDVACGTGILARELLARLRYSRTVAAIDPNLGMLHLARQLAPAIEWREAVAESLPFPDQSFDAVLSQFGLMFFKDRRQALREMLRVLAPSGRLVVAVWDALENIPAYAAEVALLHQTAGLPAADAVRAPFVLGNRNDLSDLFSQSGAPAPTITTLQGLARFPSIRIMVEADLRGWLPALGVILTGDQMERILQQAEHALRSFTTAEGSVEFPISAHLVVAKKA